MLVLDFINVGNGDSILIQELEGGARRFAMLVDCGHDSLVRDDHPGELDPRSCRIYAGDFLKKRGIERLDLLLATHFHRDHWSGLHNQTPGHRLPPLKLVYLPDIFRMRVMGRWDPVTKSLLCDFLRGVIALSSPDLLDQVTLSHTLRFTLADLLRAGGVEPEYADRDHVVLMASGSTDGEAFRAVEDALHAVAPCRGASRPAPPLAKGERVISVREALFAPRETVQAGESLGRICGAPTVSCPPAVPVAVSGERIGEEALTLFRYYGVEAVDVLKE